MIKLAAFIDELEKISEDLSDDESLEDKDNKKSDLIKRLAGISGGALAGGLAGGVASKVLRNSLLPYLGRGGAVPVILGSETLALGGPGIGAAIGNKVSKGENKILSGDTAKQLASGTTGAGLGLLGGGLGTALMAEAMGGNKKVFSSNKKLMAALAPLIIAPSLGGAIGVNLIKNKKGDVNK